MTTIADLQKQLEEAQKQKTQALLEKSGEYFSTSEKYASVYLKLAKACMDEFVKNRDFPIEIIGDENTLYLFHHKNKVYITFRLRDEKIATIKFSQCMLSELRYSSGLTIDGQPVNIFDTSPSPIEIVEDSLWLKEIEDIYKSRDNYNQEFWQTQNHYIVRFLSEIGSGLRVSEAAFKTHLFHSWIGKLPMIFDCIAQSFEVEIHQENMNNILTKISEQIFAEEERA